MKIWHRITLILAAVILLAGCGSNQVSGNGKVVTKTRTIENFNKIAIRGAYQVVVTQGNQDSLKITTDSNIVPLVMTKVKDKQLSIYNRKGISFSLTKPVMVQLIVKNLEEVTASGANALVISSFSGNGLKIDTSGSINAILAGKVRNLSMQISGSGKINATKLVAKNVNIRLIGSGQVMVHATDKLDTKITGSGSIMYSGNPDNVGQSIIGSGTLKRVK